MPRKSDFRNIVDAMQSALPAAARSAAMARRPADRMVGLALIMTLPKVTRKVFPPRRGFCGSAHSAYADAAGTVRHPTPQAWLKHVMTLDDLRAQLHLSPGRRKLQSLRRQFALARHPDLFTNDDRELATLEMQIANDLLDRAIKYTVPRQHSRDSLR